MNTHDVVYPMKHHAFTTSVLDQPFQIHCDMLVFDGTNYMHFVETRNERTSIPTKLLSSQHFEYDYLQFLYSVIRNFLNDV